MFGLIIVSFPFYLFQYYPFGFNLQDPAAAAPIAPAARVVPASPVAPAAPVNPVIVVAAPVRTTLIFYMDRIYINGFMHLYNSSIINFS